MCRRGHDAARPLGDPFALSPTVGCSSSATSRRRRAWHETHLTTPDDYRLGEHDGRWLRRRLRPVDAGGNVPTRSRVARVPGREPRPAGAFLDGVTPTPDPVAPVLAAETRRGVRAFRINRVDSRIVSGIATEIRGKIRICTLRGNTRGVGLAREEPLTPDTSRRTGRPGSSPVSRGSTPGRRCRR
jgi:hypothetical protein